MLNSIKRLVKAILKPFARPVLNRVRLIIREELAEIHFISEKLRSNLAVVHEALGEQILAVEARAQDIEAKVQALENHNQAIAAQLQDIKTQIMEINSFVTQRLCHMPMYSGHMGWEYNFMHSFYAALRDEQLDLKFTKLISGLDDDSRNTVVRAINRLRQAEGNKNALNIFTQSEQRKIAGLQDQFYTRIIKLSEDLFCYEKYFLPVDHFEAGVFYYRHGLDHVENIAAVKNKDIIDAGGFIGDSALIFAGLTDKKIYSFEPMSANAALMRKTFELNKLENAVIERLALGEAQGEAELIVWDSCSTIGATTNLNIHNPATEKIKVDTLDNYVAAHNLDVGLIKVDVEGFEQPLLRGAVNTIKTQKPVLLISIYHSMDDFFNIKPLIESWDLGYRFKIVKPVDGAIILETMLIAEVAA